MVACYDVRAILDIAIIPRIPRSGDVIAEQYVLDREIGRGSMGVVYAAHQLGLERRVAIKMLLPKALVIDGVIERFHRGARLASSLTHPHAVIIYAIGNHHDPDGGHLPFMAMEHLEGEDLYDYIERKGRLTLDESLWMLEQALGSLAEAHSKSIIHRDLKPENLFVSLRADGQRLIKVLDFGLAKAVMEGWEDRERRLTATGMTCGTPEYMAPEQAVGEPHITPALDIYALGCILFHMLTGEAPFPGTSPMTIALKHVTDPPPPLPPEYRGTPVEAIIRRTLAKRPEARFQDAAEFAAALDAMANGVDPSKEPGWPEERLLSLTYRITSEEERLLEAFNRTSSPEWALGTVKMTPVKLPPQPTNPQAPLPLLPLQHNSDAGPTTLMPMATARPYTSSAEIETVVRPIADLIDEFGAESLEGSESGADTMRTAAPKELLTPVRHASQGKSPDFDPGLVSVNVRGKPYANPLDYSEPLLPQTLITPTSDASGAGHRGGPDEMRVVRARDRASAAKPAPSQSPARDARDKAAPVSASEPAPTRRSSSMALWAVIIIIGLMVIAALTILAVSVIPHLSSEGGSKFSTTPNVNASSASVTIQLTSEPAKVRVYDEKGKKIGVTPIKLNRSRADKTERFTFKKEGFEDFAKHVPMSEDSSFKIKLKKIKSWDD